MLYWLDSGQELCQVILIYARPLRLCFFGRHPSSALEDKKITTIAAMRRPANKFAGYTLRSPPFGGLLEPHLYPNRSFMI